MVSSSGLFVFVFVFLLFSCSLLPDHLICVCNIQIKNPQWKGEWKPRKIPNPAYKGPWKAPKIPNPEFKEDPELYVRNKVGSVGLEIWQVKSGTIFDNVIVTDDFDEAKDLAERTWKANKEAEKKAFDAIQEEKRKKEEDERKKREEEAKKKKKEEEEEEESSASEKEEKDEEEKKPKEEEVEEEKAKKAKRCVVDSLSLSLSVFESSFTCSLFHFVFLDSC